MNRKQKAELVTKLNYGIKCKMFSQKTKRFKDTVVYLDETNSSSFRWIDSSMHYFDRVFEFGNLKRVEFSPSMIKLSKRHRLSHEVKSFLVSVISKDSRELLFLCESIDQKNELACTLKHFTDKGGTLDLDVKYFLSSSDQTLRKFIHDGVFFSKHFSLRFPDIFHCEKKTKGAFHHRVVQKGEQKRGRAPRHQRGQAHFQHDPHGVQRQVPEGSL